VIEFGKHMFCGGYGFECMGFCIYNYEEREYLVMLRSPNIHSAFRDFSKG
jgi:hypothetical protein